MYTYLSIITLTISNNNCLHFNVIWLPKPFYHKKYQKKAEGNQGMQFKMYQVWWLLCLNLAESKSNHYKQKKPSTFGCWWAVAMVAMVHPLTFERGPLFLWSYVSAQSNLERDFVAELNLTWQQGQKRLMVQQGRCREVGVRGGGWKGGKNHQSWGGNSGQSLSP